MNRSSLNNFRSSVGVGQQSFYNQDQRSNNMFNSPYNKGGNAHSAVKPGFAPPVKPVGPVMPNLNQPGGMTTNQWEVANQGMGGPKPSEGSAYNANYNMLTGQNPPAQGAPTQPVDDRGGGGAPLRVEGEMMPGQPVGMGQPAMPAFNLAGRDNPRAGLRPGSPHWAQYSQYFQNRRNNNAQPPKPNPYQTDPYEGGNIVGPAQPNRF